MLQRSSAIGLASALAAGATLMCLFDPSQGRRRRALLADRSRRLTRRVREATGTRQPGAVELTTPMDRVLVERVRATLGQHVSYPYAIDVVVRNGTVCLSGPILVGEAIELLNATRDIAGVESVEDCLERHSAADIPSLRFAGLPRRASHGGWSPRTRTIAGVGAVAGVVLGALAWSRVRAIDIDAGDGWDPAGFA